MDTIEMMKMLKSVVEYGSFSAAARRLRVSRSVVSRGIEALENEIGVRLVNRTTRALSLTEAGKAYFVGSKQILSDIDLLKSSVAETETRLKGTLYISSPIHFGEWRLLPVIEQFLKAHPDISFRLDLNNKFENVIDGGFDLMIRTAPFLDDSSFVARRVCTNRFLLCASPEYQNAHGAPAHPEELASHRCIASGQHGGRYNWIFTAQDGSLISVPITPRLEITAGSAQIRAVKSGLGIALIPDYIANEAFRTGELVQLLPEFPHEHYPVYVIYPQKKMLPVRTRKFLDALTSAL